VELSDVRNEIVPETEPIGDDETDGMTRTVVVKEIAGPVPVGEWPHFQ